MPQPTIHWQHDLVRLIDQTKLPGELVHLELTDYRDLAEAIKRLSVRGAPAIGVAAAYGVVLAAREYRQAGPGAFRSGVEEAMAVLAATRPTAVNLFWALDRMKKLLDGNRDLSPADMTARLLTEAEMIRGDDDRICRRIGENGAALIPDGTTILTHCNAGGLATASLGTALSPVYVAHEQGKKVHVFADETRPLLQGARLTSWELTQAGIAVTLICDNMAAFAMKQRKIDMVIVGADRIAANGDTANKIGTYNVAVLARRHGIPFYVAAPVSTFDLSLPDGSGIPIEERDPDEVRTAYGNPVAPADVAVYNPAFDVTEAELITGIITENGIIERPATETVASVVGQGV